MGVKKQAAKRNFFAAWVRVPLASLLREQEALIFAFGLSAGRLHVETVGGMLIQFSPGMPRRLCYLCGMLILMMRGNGYASGKDTGKGWPP